MAPLPPYAFGNPVLSQDVFAPYWQRELVRDRDILNGLLGAAPIRELFDNTTIDTSYANKRLLCANTATHTLPDPTEQRGWTYYFFNNDVGVITISGTINGSPSYVLAAKYDYVEVMSDGAEWLVVSNN